MNASRLLDPTDETTPIVRDRLRPPTHLVDAVVGLLCISKRRSDEFLDRVEQGFGERGITVTRFAKPSHSKTAPEGVLQNMVEHCDVVIEALAD